MEVPQAPIQQTAQHPALRRPVDYVGYYIDRPPSRSSVLSAPSPSPSPLGDYVPVPVDRSSVATAEGRAPQRQVSSYPAIKHERPSSSQPHHRGPLIVGGGTNVPNATSRDSMSRDSWQVNESLQHNPWRPANLQAPSGRQYINTQASDNATVVQGDVSTHFVNINVGTGEQYARRIDRINQVFENYTIETIHSFVQNGPIQQRGAASTVQKHWERKEDLGAGLFGEVHREEYRDPQGNYSSRAVKVLRRRQLERLQIDYKKELDALIRLSKPDYNHLFVEFYCWYEDRGSILIAMEYVALGDLKPFVEKKLPELEIKAIASQLLEAICVMHRLDLVHRDIKPDNVFIVSTYPWHVKLGDFGVCKSTTTRQTTLQTSVGTDGYKAPEILALVHSEKAGQYSEKCDIWSYGCLVYELLSGRVPFSNTQRLGTFCRRGNCYELDWLRDTHYQAWQFISQLLKASPRQRLTAAQALLAGNSWFDTAACFEQYDSTISASRPSFANAYDHYALSGRYRSNNNTLHESLNIALDPTWTDQPSTGGNHHQTSAPSTAPGARYSPHRPASVSPAQRDRPFAMTPQELEQHQQHQQHLLHDQLFQQYHYLQLQEQELRLQLYRHRRLRTTAGPVKDHESR